MNLSLKKNSYVNIHSCRHWNPGTRIKGTTMTNCNLSHCVFQIERNEMNSKVILKARNFTNIFCRILKHYYWKKNVENERYRQILKLKQKWLIQHLLHAFAQYIFMYVASVPLRSQAPQLLYIAHLSSAILFLQVLVPGQTLQANVHFSASISLYFGWLQSLYPSTYTLQRSSPSLFLHGSGGGVVNSMSVKNKNMYRSKRETINVLVFLTAPIGISNHSDVSIS